MPTDEIAKNHSQKGGWCKGESGGEATNKRN